MTYIKVENDSPQTQSSLCAVEPVPAKVIANFFSSFGSFPIRRTKSRDSPDKREVNETRTGSFFLLPQFLRYKEYTTREETRTQTMRTYYVIAAILIAGANGQESFKCPDDFGFYPHHISCDKYWKCDNNVAELKTCGNGLAFDASDSKFLTENCDYLHNVDCGERTQLEPAINTPHCPRLYGIFADDKKCDVFWNCWNGESSRYQCSPGLAYDREARVCMWADQVPECKNEEVAGGFNCPAAGEVSGASGSFSRHAHPEDCRKYYICLEGIAREYGCPIGTVFKIGDADGSGACEDPEDVPGCEDYYGDLDLKSIRKSELLAGIQNSGEIRKPHGQGKPRPPSAPARPNAPQE